MGMNGRVEMAEKVRKEQSHTNKNPISRFSCRFSVTGQIDLDFAKNLELLCH